MQSDLDEQLTLSKDDIPYRKQKASAPKQWFLAILLMAFMVTITFFTYQHNQKINQIQTWLTGDAENLEKIGNQLLGRFLVLEKQNEELQKTLKGINVVLSATKNRSYRNARINKSQADLINADQVKLDEVQNTFAHHENQIANLDTTINSAFSSYKQRFNALDIQANEFSAFVSSSKNFRRTTNTSISDIDKQLARTRISLDKLTRELAEQKRLLVKIRMQAEAQRQPSNTTNNTTNNTTSNTTSE